MHILSTAVACGLALTLLVLHPSSALAQSCDAAPGLTIHRSVPTSGECGGQARGIAVDPDTGDVHFIADSGSRVCALHGDDSMTQLSSRPPPSYGGSYSFGGRLSDLAIGPDGLLYAGSTNGGHDGWIWTFDPALPGGDPQMRVQISPDETEGNAFGIDLDVDGRLFASEDSEVIWTAGPLDTEVTALATTHPSGEVFEWRDIDAINRGWDGASGGSWLFVHDGTSSGGHTSSRHVYVMSPEGVTYTTTASTLASNTYDGAFDFCTGSYFAGQNNGDLVLLAYDDADLVADSQTVVCTGLDGQNDVAYGPSSFDSNIYSIYVVSSDLLVEIAGTCPPGMRIDDDQDGYCELGGSDLNGDGDCADEPWENSGGTDCDDTDEEAYPGAPERCNGGDDDCDGETDDDGHDEDWFGEPCDGADLGACEDGIFGCEDSSQVCLGDDDGDDLDLCNGDSLDDCDDSSADGSGESWFGAPCDGPDTDECEEGVYDCVAGGQVCTDADDGDDDVEECNGSDDDCDGEIDEEGVCGGGGDAGADAAPDTDADWRGDDEGQVDEGDSGVDGDGDVDRDGDVDADADADGDWWGDDDGETDGGLGGDGDVGPDADAGPERDDDWLDGGDDADDGDDGDDGAGGGDTHTEEDGGGQGDGDGGVDETAGEDGSVHRDGSAESGGDEGSGDGGTMADGDSVDAPELLGRSGSGGDGCNCRAAQGAPRLRADPIRFGLAWIIGRAGAR